jgi:DNA topoisomerase I
MANLVIVESPAKCSKIQGFLGFGWKVIASLGHIRHLKEDLESIGLEKDFEPTWEWMKEKAKAIANIKEAAKSANKIYLASDDDREGEMIAYSVCLLLKLDSNTTPRAVFHEITKTAVLNAVNNPRTIDMNKVNAAQARTMLDMMVGFTISPLLWKNVGPGLSAGRCQTPALRLVVDKEQDIKNFKGDNCWKVHGTWRGIHDSTIWEASMQDNLEDQESAENYLDNLHSIYEGTVNFNEIRPWSESAPSPLITSTLQQQASSLFRCGPKDTMKIAQRLYEAGHITYMRTDKAVLSEEAIKSAEEYIIQKYGEEYIQQVKKKEKTKKSKKDEEGAKAQEAHEAIRPTHIDIFELPDTEDWSARDRKIYQLIWLRTVQSVMASARGLQRTITFNSDADEDGEFEWRSSWRKTEFLGWRKASTKETTEESETSEKEIDETLWTSFEKLTKGQKVIWETLMADPHETKAPQRYTEASLIRELELRGIGRPSTFANLISTVLDKEYVKTQTFEGREVDITKLKLSKRGAWPPEITVTKQKMGGEKDRLTPTPLGLSVLEFLVKHFEDLFNYGFTAQMEGRLDKIAEGSEGWKTVLQNTWNAYKDRYETLKATKTTTTVQQGDRRKEFSGGIVAVLGKKGPLLLKEGPDGDKDKTVFYGWPEGQPFMTITEEQVKKFVDSVAKEKEGFILGEHEGFPVIKKQGKFGFYVEWNGKTTSCGQTDSLEQVISKFAGMSASVLRTVGQFEIRQGPYGPYMFKPALTGSYRKFVSVPDTIDITNVTEKDLIAIFQAGLKAKARSGAYGKTEASGEGWSRGGRGGFRGRGRGRGRGQ